MLESAALVLAAATAILVITATIRDALSMNSELERQLQSRTVVPGGIRGGIRRAGDQDGVGGRIKGAGPGQYPAVDLAGRGWPRGGCRRSPPVCSACWFSLAVGVAAP